MWALRSPSTLLSETVNSLLQRRSPGSLAWKGHLKDYIGWFHDWVAEMMLVKIVGWILRK